MHSIISNQTIRYEKPILDLKVKIVYEDKDYLAVEKPPSWPCHSNSNYFHNSLTKILKDEYQYEDLKILHRIDRPTSGLVVFAFNKDALDLYTKCREKGEIKKKYVCRVIGDFPDDLFELSAPIAEKNSGVFYVADSGKESLTKFKKIFYDEPSNTSVVEASPVTGRTHQIRVHLSYLKFPIANDPIYGGEYYNGIEGFSDNVKELESFAEYTPEQMAEGRLVFFKLWLHSCEYAFDKYVFKADLPDWSERSFEVKRKF